MTLPLPAASPEPERPHTCHARGCSVPVPPERLMCLDHWRRVPRAVQRAVWRAYRPGQCDDKRPSAEWFVAADAAIGYVSLRNGGRVTASEATALRRFGFEVPA